MPSTEARKHERWQDLVIPAEASPWMWGAPHVLTFQWLGQRSTCMYVWMIHSDHQNPYHLAMHGHWPVTMEALERGPRGPWVWQLRVHYLLMWVRCWGIQRRGWKTRDARWLETVVFFFPTGANDLVFQPSFMLHSCKQGEYQLCKYVCVGCVQELFLISGLNDDYVR